MSEVNDVSQVKQSSVVRFPTGAVRSADADNERFDLVPLGGIIRVARTAAEGAVKYGPYNWEHGMPLSTFLNHALRHIYLYLLGDTCEDHLGHASWNLLAACHVEDYRKDLCDIPLQQRVQSYVTKKES
jgi:hypothetical protein